MKYDDRSNDTVASRILTRAGAIGGSGSLAIKTIQRGNIHGVIINLALGCGDHYFGKPNNGN
jgi:hypothetical protein